MAAGASVAAGAAAPRRRIGVELGCVGANKWTPYQFLDYFKKTGIEAAQFNAGTLGVKPTGPDETELRKVRAYAENLGISLLSFSGGSICPTASNFNLKAGTAEEQIARGIAVARIIGATSMRVVLGSFKERPEIARHLDSMIAVLKNVRGRVRDSGVKLALENHNADLQAGEIRTLIQEVGPDLLGVCIDTGNPLMIMEDPHLTLEVLGPYIACTHVRDTYVWRVPEGAAVRWVNMGEGNVDIDGWIRKFVKMYPAMPVTFENLPTAEPRIVPIFTADAFRYFPKMPATDLAGYLSLAERGKPLPPPAETPGKSRGQLQCENLDVCVRYTRRLLDSI
jgi:3-oxoisoapionate decarboxylase